MSVSTVAVGAVIGVGAVVVVAFGIAPNFTVQMGELYVDCSQVQLIEQNENEVVLACNDADGNETGARVALPRAVPELITDPPD